MPELRGRATAVVRPAVEGDAEAINAVYNHYVLTSTCTFQTEPSTTEERTAWLVAHDREHPVVAAELDGQLVGWGALSRYRSRQAYLHTVEDTVYVRDDMRRRGVGGEILRRLIALGRDAGHHVIVALIVAGQDGSIALHRRLGFEEAGRLREVGWKFDRWLDVIYMQLTL